MVVTRQIGLQLVTTLERYPQTMAWKALREDDQA